jgi:cell shape-determining protein MreD
VQFRMKSALIGATVGMVLGFLMRIGTFTWMVPTASNRVEAAAYWISHLVYCAFWGFVLAGFSSKRLPQTPSR